MPPWGRVGFKGQIRRAFGQINGRRGGDLRQRSGQFAALGTRPSGHHAPRSQPQLSRLIASDVQVLADWITAGAPEFPAVKPRPAIKLETTLQAIVADLRRLPDTRTRARQRYFSLDEPYNNAAIGDETLQLNRAALVKALNSLSWEREVVTKRCMAFSALISVLFPDALGP